MSLQSIIKFDFSGVVFELRGKPFGLRDTGQSESIYALCRKWMYGKDDDPQDQESGFLDEHEYENSKSLVFFLEVMFRNISFRGLAGNQRNQCSTSTTF